MRTGSETGVTLPALLSLNAGYVDSATYLALQGLFTAHVTGNFVTLGASLALGTAGAVAKTLALPTFCAAVIVARLLNTVLSNSRWPAFEILIALHLLLLLIGAALAIQFGPFHDIDGWRAVLTGMVLLAAMAIQNAFHRIHLPSVPPSTIMTGTTTQVMTDLADRIHAPNATEYQPVARRLVQMSRSMLCFAIGCAAAALLYKGVGIKCFVVPPIVGSLLLVLRLIGRSQSGAQSSSSPS